MVAFPASLFLAILYASSGLAVPWPASLKHATNRLRIAGRGLELNTFHPESTYTTFGEGIAHPLIKRAEVTLEEKALAFIQSHLNIAPDAVVFKSGFAGEVAEHAFLRQAIDGIPVANAVANVAFNKDDNVVAVGSSFVPATNVASSVPSVSLADAITAAEGALDGTFNRHPPTLEFLALEDGSLRLTHVFQIQNEDTNAWVEAFVDAHTAELLSITDFVAKASYLVLPIQEEILTQGFQTLVDPQDPLDSPDGWHSDGTTTTTTTAGNNAVSFKGAQTATTAESAAGLVFNYPQNAATAPTTAANVDAARVNAFYLVNTVHDFSYRYGFTEAAFNFQNNNFGKGGAGNDRVTISVQNSAGVDNADFSTPPDGQSGAMRMFLWDETNPERDGALENDIVTHENTHGITNRMTGGGTGRCLQTTEAGGMGEGWSDSMADWNEKTSSAVPDYVLGQYVTNDPAGIRSHPYSTSATVNPLRYSSLVGLTEVHAIGEVWANMLHNVYAALVAVHGFSTTARTNPDGTEGNIVFLHLFIDALALQPCNPTFLTARSAWIQADVNRYGGANACTLWTAFASRGLGTNAANHVDGTAVPAGC
ncbi:Fungalysin metallopeptidase-domain-containing protein [Mycena sanguinolenta]|nr:Fungalysin metallopeptidase-domain-containing protein [Mycena sanguinolenta]